jgi:hypothetical protein
MTVRFAWVGKFLRLGTFPDFIQVLPDTLGVGIYLFFINSWLAIERFLGNVPLALPWLILGRALALLAEAC